MREVLDRLTHLYEKQKHSEARINIYIEMHMNEAVSHMTQKGEVHKYIYMQQTYTVMQACTSYNYLQPYDVHK